MSQDPVEDIVPTRTKMGVAPSQPTNHTVSGRSARHDKRHQKGVVMGTAAPYSGQETVKLTGSSNTMPFNNHSLALGTLFPPIKLDVSSIASQYYTPSNPLAPGQSGPALMNQSTNFFQGFYDYALYNGNLSSPFALQSFVPSRIAFLPMTPVSG
jgi:hypothetical protein